MTLSMELAGETLFFLMLATGMIQLGYYWLVFRRFAFFRKKEARGGNQPVSVIICARNESKNLQRFLPSLLDQAYPEYEVIVVNDCSWDDSGEFLEAFAKGQPRLKVVTIKEQEKYSHGKKFALTLGIKAASHELLLFTDADCRPSGKNWLTYMQDHFTKETEIVLGYGAYEKGPGFLNRMIRFDTCMIAMQYFSFALGGNAYMGVGRNLAYRKSTFFKNKGFAKHNHLPSGDDDLFVNETATPSNTAIEVSPEAFTYSIPKQSFGSWFTQKKRHVSTSKYYRSGHRFQLGLFSLSSILFFLALGAVLALRHRTMWAGVLYGSVLLLKMPVAGMSASRLREKDLIVLFPVLELLHFLLQPFFYIAQLFSKKRAWK